MNNAGQNSSRQPHNPAWDELGTTAEVAAKACLRWIRRLDNALVRLGDSHQGQTEVAILEEKAQAILHGPRRGAGLAKLELEVWRESGPERISIDLDPSRSAQEQAQDWIAQVRKKKRGWAQWEERHQILETEKREAMIWKDRLALWLCESTCPPKAEIRNRQAELEGLAKRLVPRGLWPQPPPPKDEVRPSSPIRWDFPDGWILLAGRSGTENDLLTQRIALPHDLWFHAAHVPGAHVILRSPHGKPAPVPPGLMETAAGVAAWLSKLRAQSIAEVHVTEKRHVRKPRKAPPGTVVLDHSRTLRVKPVPPPR